MKKIYSKENVLESINRIKGYFKTLYNLEYSSKQVVYAFNTLSKKYQDLLLKPNKDENDKVLLRFPYEEMRKVLMNNKEDVSNVKLKIKSLEELRKNKEEKKVEEEKKDIDIYELLSQVDMSEDDKIVVLFKYDGGVKSSSDVASELDLDEKEVNNIIGRFWSMLDSEDIKVYKK